MGNIAFLINEKFLDGIRSSTDIYIHHMSKSVVSFHTTSQWCWLL